MARWVKATAPWPPSCKSTSRIWSARAGGRFPRDDVTAFIDGRSLPVSHGDRRMPIWGNVFGWDETGDDAVAERIAQSRIAAIVDFLSEIQYE